MTQANSKKGQFTSKRSLYALAAPVDRAHIEVWHASTLGFGARIMRANSRSGEVRRVYLARFKNEKGKDEKRVLGTFDDITYDDAMKTVVELRALKKHERKTGEVPLPTLGAALDEYVAERNDKISDATVEDYRKRWGYLSEHHDRNVLICNSDWWSARHTELLKIGRPTADGVLRVAHAIYESLLDDGRMNLNPVRRVASKREIYAHGSPRQTILQRKGLPRFWGWIQTRPHVGIRDFTLICLFTGLRDAVVANLRWEQVDLDNRLLLVPAEVRGNKAKQNTYVPMADWLYENVFLPRHKSRLPNNPWVIPSHKKVGAPLRDIKGSMKTLKAETGGIHVNPHTLRRTFATIAAQATGSALLVSRMLTHSNKARGFENVPAVTAGYLITSVEDLRSAFNTTANEILRLCEVRMPGQAEPEERMSQLDTVAALQV